MSSRAAKIIDMVPKEIPDQDGKNEGYGAQNSAQPVDDSEAEVSVNISEDMLDDSFQKVQHERILHAKRKLLGDSTDSVILPNLGILSTKAGLSGVSKNTEFDCGECELQTDSAFGKIKNSSIPTVRTNNQQENVRIMLTNARENSPPEHVSAETSLEDASNDLTDKSLSDFDSDDSVADPNFQENADTHDEDSEQDKSKIKARRRKSNPETWMKNIKKRKRHSGLEHTTEKSKKVIKQKTLKSPCLETCKLKCIEKIPEEARVKIHRQYWTQQKSIDMKRQFVASHVQQIPVVRRRERNNKREGKRQHTNRYFFEHNGNQVTVCKKFFLNTLTISQQTVDTAILKKREGGLLSPDKRGRHEPANKISNEIRDNVRQHISSFPAYESHYSRERSKKKYLGNHLNISRMWKLYIEYCHEHNIPEKNIAKEWLYSDIFNHEFNFSFKNPDNDTCDECDKFKIKMQEATDQDERRTIQEQYDSHLEDANNRYKMKRADKQHSKENVTEKVVMMDLQKCLPTPDLHNSQSFYSLKLWTYNLVIHDATDEKAYCMMWDESISGRGGNEVASCLFKWSKICNIPSTVTELIIWSDNCPSQNRNVQMLMSYFFILKHNQNLRKISHKFLARGHTHLEADGDHSIIERERKKVSQLRIITPWDWQQVVRLCGTKKAFNVTAMEIDDFLNFKSLCEGNSSPYILRKKADSGESFLISQCVHLQVRQENPGVLFYKYKFTDEFSTFTMTRNTRNASSVPEILPKIRKELKNISTKKYEHLQKLLPWIPKVFHDYYRNLPHDGEESE